MKVIRNKCDSGDPLRKLLVEVVEVDKNKLAEVLKCYIRINSRDGQLVLQENFSNLNIRNKVLAYILGRKVSSMLDFGCSESVGPDEIKQATGLLRGVLTPKLIELKAEKLISRSQSSDYFVTEEQMLYIVKELEQASGKSKSEQNGFY